jgi:CRP-like cAMP-binding protein
VDVFQEAEMLRKVPFFGGLDPAKLKLLAFTSRALRFAAGEDLMRLGDPADSAYVIIEGDVEIIGQTPAGEFVIGVLGGNSLIGEMGIWAPRGTTVGERRCSAAHRGDVFLRLLTDNPVRAARDARPEQAVTRVMPRCRVARSGNAEAHAAARTSQRRRRLPDPGLIPGRLR